MVNFVEDLPTLWKVVTRLEQAAIPYMLTGSLALNFYGHIRATNDMDIVIQVTPSDAVRIYQLFAKDFYIIQETVQEAIARGGMFNVIDNETIFKVDFIMARQDPFSRRQFERRRRIQVGEQTVPVIAPEDLILAKLEWSRESRSEMQEEDIRNILRVSGGEFDKNYLETAAREIGMSARLQQIYETI